MNCISLNVESVFVWILSRTSSGAFIPLLYLLNSDWFGDNRYHPRGKPFLIRRDGVREIIFFPTLEGEPYLLSNKIGKQMVPHQWTCETCSYLDARKSLNSWCLDEILVGWRVKRGGVQDGELRGRTWMDRDTRACYHMYLRQLDKAGMIGATFTYPCRLECRHRL